jgi:fumarate hydratase class II
MQNRTETDSMGPIDVDARRYWGAQTQRSLEHFAIGRALGGERFPPRFVHAYASLKKHAALVNAQLGLLDVTLAQLIARAADEIIAGQHDDEFPLVVWQTGSGTQTNMNVNEVLAGRANELAGNARGGKKPVHPNDHVNLGQSSNDTFPTVMHVSLVTQLHDELMPATARLLATLDDKQRAFHDVIKIGRTHLQDATPLTVGQEISGWRAQLTIASSQLDATLPFLHELALGGTAVGTGLGAHPDFARLVVEELAKETGQPFVVAKNAFAALAGHEALVFLSGALSSLAAALMKVGNDVRWLASRRGSPNGYRSSRMR